MKRLVSLICLVFVFAAPTFSQSYAFGIKGGPTAGFQQWDDSFQRDPLYRYHGVAFIESADEDERFSLFAQAGYHIKGSAIRTFATTVQTPTGFRDVPSRETPFEFKNISLTAGGKQRYDLGGTKGYWMLGLRGDYTLGTQLGPEIDQNDLAFTYFATFFPVETFVENFMFGATIGGGFEFPISELIDVILELTISPDFTFQYNQPQIPNIRNPNPNSSQNTITIPERQIRNVTIELSLGFRFLHIIEYID